MTVIVTAQNGREAATAASPRSAPVPLHVAYAELTAWAGGCAIETGHIGALADNECEHERLPTDTTPPCGCWPQEVTKDPPFTLEEEPMQTEPETPVATSDVVDLDDLSPFIRGLVDEIDAEVAKLVRVRAALVQK